MNNLKKIIEYGLCLLVFLLPMQTRWIIKAGDMGGYSEYLTISLYGTDILLAVILLFFIVSLVKRPKLSIINYQVSIFSPWFYIGILELSAFISIYFAEDKLSASFGYARLLLGIGLFWIISKAEYEKFKLLLSFLAGVLLQGFFAIWQFLYQTTFVSKWLGMAGHSANALAGESVIETIGGRWLRAYGSLDHPNILGGFLAIGILVMVIAALAIVGEMYDKYSEKKDWSIFPIKKIIIGIIIFYFSLIPLSAGLFFTFSRSAWLSLGVGLFFILTGLIYKKDLILKIQFFKIIFSISLAFFVLFFVYNGLVQTRVTSAGRLENKSISERITYFDDFKAVLKNNWLFGAGLNNYILAVEKNNPGRPAYGYQPVHNVFFLVWAETGIIGFLGFVGLLIHLLIKNYLRIKKSKLNISEDEDRAKPYLNINIAIIFSLVVLLSLDHWLWSLHFGVLFFWLVSGYLSREEAR